MKNDWLMIGQNVAPTRDCDVIIEKVYIHIDIFSVNNDPIRYIDF